MREMSNKDIRKKIFEKARRIVVKVGSSILASPEKGLQHEVFSHLAKEISELKRQGYEIVLVSSGAIAAGMEKLGYKTRPQSITQKQATAAVGQSRLMNIYEQYFSRSQQMVAQILLTHDDLSHRRRFLNAKVQRPGVCNAMETLLVHERVARRFLPKIAQVLEKAGVELRGCPRTREILPRMKGAKEEDWFAEYLDLILSIRVVHGVEEALEHIATYGSLHTESIVTSDYQNAQRFLREADSSCVLVNASTRFNDGFELGLGAEIGISTSKIHSFGPMGLEELTTTKFIVYGNGQIRK
jgi:hypothetical protein